MNRMNNCYSYLKKFMSKYPLTIAWRIKAHSKIIDKHLNEGEEILYAFVGQKNDRTVDIFNTYAVVLTNNFFTSSAKELAKKNNVLLWDRNKLKELIDNLPEQKNDN